MEEEAEAIGQGSGLENGLADFGVAEKAAGDQVDQGVWIVEVADKFFYIVERGADGVFHLIHFFENFGNESFAGDERGGRSGFRVFDGFGGGDTKGGGLHEVLEANAS